MDEPAVSLAPLSPEEYPEFERAMIRFYAGQSARAGRVAAEGALAWAETETRKFLPQGLDTPGHLLRTIREAGAGTVGYLWCGQDSDDPQRMHLFAIQVFEERRSRGTGSAALKLLEKELHDRGCRGITLHVYTFNEPAIRLYRRLGYRETDLVMAKEIGP